MSFKEFFSKEVSDLQRYARLLVIVFILFIIIVIYGNIKYLNTQKETKVFVETEKTKVSNYTHYPQFGTFGLRLKLILPPSYILNCNRMADIQSRIDAGERLVIYHNQKGIENFKSITNWMDFSGLVLLALGFMCIFYGLKAFSNREHLKRLLSSISKPKFLFFWMATTRVLIVIVGYILLLGIALFISFTFHHYIPFPDVLQQALYAVLTLIFLLILGLYIGLGDKKRIFAIFFLIVILLPWGGSIIKEFIAGTVKSNYKVELESLTYVMNFEREFLREFGTLNPNNRDVAPKDVKNAIRRYIDECLRKIIKQEEELIADIRKKNIVIHFLSSLFPTTFYIHNCCESSGAGLTAVIEFHEYSAKIKEKFTRWYLNKTYFEKTEPGKVVNFINRDENLYKASTPGFSLTGLICSIVWIAGFFIASVHRFKKITDFKTDIQLKAIDHLPGFYKYFFTNNIVFENAAFYQYLSRSILLNDQIVQYDFIYLPRPSDYPGNQGFFQWKNDFYHALEENKVILTTGLDEIRIHEINSPSPVVTINEVEEALREKKGFLGAIGNDYYLFKRAGTEGGYSHEKDESVPFNCFLD